MSLLGSFSDLIDAFPFTPLLSILSRVFSNDFNTFQPFDAFAFTPLSQTFPYYYHVIIDFEECTQMADITRIACTCSCLIIAPLSRAPLLNTWTQTSVTSGARLRVPVHMLDIAHIVAIRLPPISIRYTKTILLKVRSLMN